MYLTALRSASRPITANLRSIAHRRFTSTATQRSTRSWKSSAVRLSLAASIFYYFNTSPVFAEAASQTAPAPTRPDDNHSAKDGVTEKQRHTQAKIETTTHEKNIGSIKTAVPQSGAQNDMTTNDTSTEDTSQQGAYNPDTGEFNWDCSCLGGMAHGPCGEEFKSSFRCFMLSTDEPKGMDCIDHFKVMQQCFKKYPEVYGAEMADDTEDEAEPNVGDEQTDTSNVPFQADTARPNESDTTSH